ncbi:MAG: SDR family NAD(P)-dependent oxidoreductase [Planctomycetota bacterium]|nr:SDR family NAD(P)-dependent oxidoreductase [Planctomycetota bacterium]
MVYFVTGANRGIGLELVRQLIARGATVHATIRDRASGLELIETGARVLELDVTDPSSIDTLASRLGELRLMCSSTTRA